MVTVSVEFRTQKFLGTVLGTKSHFRHEKTPKVTSKYTKAFFQNYEIVTRFHKKNGISKLATFSETTEPRVLQLYLQQKRNDRYAYCAKIYRELLTDAKEHGDALSAQRYARLEKQTRDEMGKC